MGKLAVITGGTKGIGKALVEKFASEGIDVIACSRNSDDLDNLKKEMSDKPAKVYVFKADLSIKEDCLNFSEYVKSIDGKLEVLINNAGLYIPGEIHKEEDGALETMINTNVYSAYHLTRGLIDQFIGQKDGQIFNICSTASIMPYVNGGSYCVSKYALLGMTKVLREEMKQYGVKVTAVLPGATYTASWDGVDLPKERFIKPEDIANAIWSCYSLSDQAVVEELLIRPQLGDLD
ncbi:SDR family oxidoreductase [Aureibacter tunicatorum]|uniref:Short-subunit dehydrogenase n=1 Tax=Aureibacter tunicatorum TaxID=866807 RepID=A0AAE3XN93_9BACT|nr:SDR family oxidoreductase [Aureibacter tunicatorum]MDR6239010.1 short-subunit dehydrogenase [Aureibacter tunicatorum]BDD05064.1 oxidoreductase [Aureibacter tunicatorum]